MRSQTIRARQKLPLDIRVCAFIAFLVALGFGVIAPALPLLAEEFGVGNTAVGTAISAMAFMRLASAFANGMLVVRFGERAVLTWGLLMQAVTIIAAGLAPNFTLIIAFRALGGIGSAAFTIAAMALVLRRAEPETRGRSIGYYQSGFMLGAIAGPGVGGVLADINPRVPFIVYGVFLLISAAVGHVMLREPAEPAKPAAPVTSPTPTAELVGVGSIEEAPDVAAPSVRGIDPSVYRRAIIAILILNLGTGWVFYGLRNSVIPMFGTDELNLSGTALGFILLGTAIFQTVFVGLAGRWGDKRGRRPMLIGSAGLGVISLAILCLPASTAMFVVSLSLMGIAGAGLSAVPPAALADISGKQTARNATWFSMASDIGAILGPTATGVVADQISYAAAFALSALILAIGLVSAIVMRETGSRQQPAKTSSNDLTVTS